MDLQNGYKVLYEKAADGQRVFYASKTVDFADSEVIATLALDTYKLIYEKGGKLYGSVNGVPAEDDTCFTEFDKVFVKTEEGTEPAPAAMDEANMPVYDGAQIDDDGYTDDGEVEDEEDLVDDPELIED